MTVVTLAMEKTQPQKKQKDSVSYEKQLILRETEKEFHSSPNAFFSRFERLTVQDMSELRRSLEKVSKRTLVVKHAMARKIFGGLKLEEASRFLEGSVLVTFGEGEPQLVSKTLVDYAKAHGNLKLNGAILEGKLYDSDFLKALARLPSRIELLTAVAIQLKSPVTRLAMTLGGLLQSLVIALNEVQKKKGREPQAANG